MNPAFIEVGSMIGRVRDRWRGPGAGVRALVVLGAMGLAVALVWMTLQGHARIAFAGIIVTLMAVAVTFKPVMAIGFVLAYTACLGEIRRGLLYWVGWSGFDPLVLVSPAVAGLLVVQLLLSLRRLPLTPLAKLIIFLMVIMTLQIANPLQGGLMVGAGGALFYLVPLLWFWIGRAYMTTEVLSGLFVKVMLPMSIVGALMGIYQAFYGLLPHQQKWIDVAGYAALRVSDKVRPFSVFSAASEYATYVGSVAMVLVAVALVRWRAIGSVALIAIPVLWLGMFLQGSRGIMVKTLVVASGLWAIKDGHPTQWPPRLLLALVVAGGGGYLALSQLQTREFEGETGALVRHQVMGLANPLDEKHSTAGTHGSMFLNGFVSARRNPAGYGLGSTTMAAGKFGGRGGGTEYDISDCFVALGVPGGLAYMVIVGMVLWYCVRWWMTTRSVVPLAILGVLVLGMGTWLHGTNYSLVPIWWLSIGAIDRWWIGQRNGPQLMAEECD